jgi:threonine dehydratase
MPDNTPETYLSATRGYGATLDLQPNIADAFAKLDDYQAKGRTVIHPFDDEQVITGQATVGAEIAEDLSDVTDVVVSIGGGGLASGVALAMKLHNSATRVWGVETEGADAMAKAIQAGEPVTLPAITSIAKTLGAPYVTERTLKITQDYLESVTVVPDAEAVEALQFIAQRLKVITEPSASCTLAAAERLKNNFTPDSRVVLIFCGGNTSIADACGYLATFNNR